MKLTRAIAIAVIATSGCIGYVQAQSSGTSAVPAEFPPASFQGRQYVDSNGCVFIRAGIDGNVTWVPRVSRSRKMVCGFQPSLPKLAKAKAPAAEVKPEKTVAAKPKVKKVAKPKKVVKVQKPKPQPAPVPVAAAPTVAAAPAKPVKTVETAKKVKKVRTVKKAAPACPGASRISQRYIGSGSGVRCGPQQTPHVFYSGVDDTRPVQITVPAATATPGTVAPGTRVVKRRIYKTQQESLAGVYVPAGYKPAWTDDRLSAYRTQQTFEGQAQMDLVWTETVPRYLINRDTGREVTYKYPGLQYPYTSFEEQAAAGVEITTRGQVVPDPVILRGGGQVLSTRSQPVTAVKPAATAPTQTLSTRSSAPQTPARAASHRFVQVGHFTTEAKARAAAQRLIRSGLTARMGTSRHKGATYFVVVAGPYKTQAALQGALGKVRQAGYPGASLRK